MIRHLITRAAVFWLRRHQPAYLAGFLLRSRRPPAPTNDEARLRRLFGQVDERMKR